MCQEHSTKDLLHAGLHLEYHSSLVNGNDCSDELMYRKQHFGTTNSKVITDYSKVKKLVRYKVKYERTLVMDHQITSDSGDTKKESTLKERRAFLLLVSN